MLLREKIRIDFGHNIPYIFSHPDFTVGSGISPDRLFRVRRLYCRYGISPFPKDIIFFKYAEYRSTRRIFIVCL